MIQLPVFIPCLLLGRGILAAAPTGYAVDRDQTCAVASTSLIQMKSKRDRSKVKQEEVSAAQQILFASSDGNAENGAGTLQNPMDLRSCVNALKTGSSECKLLGGTYHLESTLEVSSLSGKSITAADSLNPPIIDGTKTIDPSSWTWEAPSPTGCRTGCWSASLATWKAEPWQLFIGDKMMVNARWPNAEWEDKSMFEATKSWAFSSNKSTFSGPSQCAKDPPNGGSDCLIGGQQWQYNSKTKKCENIHKMECRNAMKGGMVPNTAPAECTMHDATPDRETSSSKPLVQEGFNASGASVILNVGHWTSYAGTVKKHTGGSFTYMSRPGWNIIKFVHDHTIYYLENHIQLLDVPGEWFYDQSSKKVYLKTKNDANPNTFSGVSARVLDYAFHITDSNDITISNLKFFASTIFAAGTRDKLLTGMTLDGVAFDYPSAQKRMLGDVDASFPTTVANHPTKQKEAVSNIIKNCVFRYTEASPTLDLSNPGFHISNNQFEYIDWSAVSTITASKMLYRSACAQRPLPGTAKGCFSPGAATLELPAGTVQAPLVFTRNTVAHHGASNGVGVYGSGTKSTLSLNRIFGKTDLQLDGGLASIPAGAANGVVMERNWLYDSMPQRPHAAKWGARFDRGQSECSRKWGENGQISQNVIFHTNGINAKGNGHKIIQNTVLWSGHEAIDDTRTKAGSRDINLYGSEGGIGTCECMDADCKQPTCCKVGDDWTFENKMSVMAGNAMESGAGATGGLPWKISTQDVNQVYKSQGLLNVQHNSAGSIQDVLRDPHNLDFRPAEASVQAHQCIGAYSGSSISEYWIPGHQERLPTVPVPPHESSTVKETATLAFNPASGAVKHYLYISKQRSDLDVAMPAREKRKRKFHNAENLYIWKVGNSFMKPGNTVYWRVDPDFGDGPVRGHIWEFTVETKVTQPPSACKLFAGQSAALNDRPKNGNPNTYLRVRVPKNGGMPTRYEFASVEVCIDASYPSKDMMRSLTFKLRHSKSNGAKKSIFLAKPFGNHGKGIPKVSGCFNDAATGAYPAGAAPWKPKNPITALFASSGLETEAQDFDLHTYDQKNDGVAGEVASWSIRICYSEAASQTLDGVGTGMCQTYPYKQ